MHRHRPSRARLLPRAMSLNGASQTGRKVIPGADGTPDSSNAAARTATGPRKVKRKNSFLIVPFREVARHERLSGQRCQARPSDALMVGVYGRPGRVGASELGGC